MDSDTNDHPPKDPDEYCNARKTDGSGYCQQPAGMGTDHLGYGRCKFHGGDSPSGDKAVLDELEDAATDAATALRLRLKQAREKAEADEFDDIDWGEIDRHARTVFDRTDNGPTETKEVTGEAGGPVEVNFTEEVVETPWDHEDHTN